MLHSLSPGFLKTITAFSLSATIQADIPQF